MTYFRSNGRRIAVYVTKSARFNELRNLDFVGWKPLITWPSPSRDYGMVGISSASEHVMRGFDCQHDLVILV